jgi:hypothetical protein
MMNNGNEWQTGFPGAAKVLDRTAALVVTFGDTLAPQKKTLLASYSV